MATVLAPPAPTPEEGFPRVIQMAPVAGPHPAVGEPAPAGRAEAEVEAVAAQLAVLAQSNVRTQLHAAVPR